MKDKTLCEYCKTYQRFPKLTLCWRCYAQAFKKDEIMIIPKPKSDEELFEEEWKIYEKKLFQRGGSYSMDFKMICKNFWIAGRAELRKRGQELMDHLGI